MEVLKKMAHISKKEIKGLSRFVVRVPYCDAQVLLSRGESCGAAVKLGSGSGVYGWNWDAFRLTNSAGGAVIVVTGYRDLFGDECREITRKYEEKARAVEGLGLSWKKAAAKYAKLCRDFADAVTVAHIVEGLPTTSGGFLTGWGYGKTFETLEKTATKAAEAVRPFLIFEKGNKNGAAGDVFGLPYTSEAGSAGGAAVWNTNAQAFALIEGGTGEKYYFKGVYLKRTGDGKPQAVAMFESFDPIEKTLYLTVAEVCKTFARIR